jgi:hypothetical protein
LAAIPNNVPKIISIASATNDQESLYFAMQIRFAFGTAGGWQVYSEMRQYGALMFGVFIPGPENETVLAIRAAFTAAGIPFRTDTLGSYQGMGGFVFGRGAPPAAIVFVASKNPPQ